MDTKKYEVLEKTVELSSLTSCAGARTDAVGRQPYARRHRGGLQLPLLKRTRTGARLTPEGEQMMPHP